MAQEMDWDDIANMWWTHFEDMQTDRTPRQGIKRGRSRSRTPATKKRSDRAPSRAKGMQPRKLAFSSARTRSRSRSASVPRKKPVWGKAAFMAANKGKSSAEVERAWRKTAQGKRNQATLNKLSHSRKVRHNLTRKDARKTMPRGKPYARRTTKRPKGAYRGAVMPRWAKGETKHVLIRDGHESSGSNQISTSTYLNTIESVPSDDTGIFKMDIGDIKTWSLNPIKQGHTRSDRNGASVDGTYLRIQGHIHNTSHEDGNTDNGTTYPAFHEGGKQRCYVRMLALAVKGQSVSSGRSTAMFDKDNLFKKIDGSIVGFSTTAGAAEASDRVRTLQLPINKQNYTVLFDRKMELAGHSEGFGASDRLFDFKMKLKQKTSWADAKPGHFERNQIVFVVMTVDPSMDSTAIGTGANQNAARNEAIQLEFESKYSYKDF